MAGTVGQPHQTEHLHGGSLGLLPTCTGNEGRNHDILHRRKLGQQLMELKHETDVPVTECRKLLLTHLRHAHPVDNNRTTVGAVQRAHNLKQRCLACATGSYDAGNLASLYL